MKYIIISKKKWDQNNFKGLSRKFVFQNKVNFSKIKKINPKIIFFIHWSKIIKKEIYKKYLCIKFHSSNLPKGRGGSPIQHQILSNMKKTKLTAFKISNLLDAGPICLKKDLSLMGSAEEILKRMEHVSLKMIKEIIKTKKLKFKKQIGKSSFYRRRKPSESLVKLNKLSNLNNLYNFLRMLDAPGYPKAFIELNKFRFTFQNIKMNKKVISAFVEIKKNEKK